MEIVFWVYEIPWFSSRPLDPFIETREEERFLLHLEEAILPI
jgi:hypothetical protein